MFRKSVWALALAFLANGSAVAEEEPHTGPSKVPPPTLPPRPVAIAPT